MLLLMALCQLINFVISILTWYLLLFRHCPEYVQTTSQSSRDIVLTWYRHWMHIAQIFSILFPHFTNNFQDNVQTYSRNFSGIIQTWSKDVQTFLRQCQQIVNILSRHCKDMVKPLYCILTIYKPDSLFQVR